MDVANYSNSTLEIKRVVMIVLRLLSLAELFEEVTTGRLMVVVLPRVRLCSSILVYDVSVRPPASYPIPVCTKAWVEGCGLNAVRQIRCQEMRWG